MLLLTPPQYPRLTLFYAVTEIPPQYPQFALFYAVTDTPPPPPPPPPQYPHFTLFYAVTDIPPQYPRFALFYTVTNIHLVNRLVLYCCSSCSYFISLPSGLYVTWFTSLLIGDDNVSDINPQHRAGCTSCAWVTRKAIKHSSISWLLQMIMSFQTNFPGIQYIFYKYWKHSVIDW